MNRILHPLAIVELNEVSLWYESIDSDISKSFVLEFEKQANKILENPYLYNIRDHGCRRVNLRRFPYYLPYAIEKDEIVILAVAHQSRKPGYWENRI